MSSRIALPHSPLSLAECGDALPRAYGGANVADTSPIPYGNMLPNRAGLGVRIGTPSARVLV